MSSWSVAVNVVAPLCLLIAMGYYAKTSGMVKKEAFVQINRIVFQLLIPIVLMKNIMETDLSVAFQPKLLGFAIGSILVMTSGLWWIVPHFVSEKRRIGVMIQALYRSNYVLFGLAIASNLYGPNNVAVTSVLIAFCVPLFNVLAVVILQYYGQDRVVLKTVLHGILTNPMLIGTLVGLAILLLRISLPTFLMSTISDVGAMATPLALLVLGGTFEWPSVAKNKTALTVIVLGRLLVLPALGVGAAILLGYRQVELVSLLVLFASPTAVSSFPMAQAMNGDGELASQAVLLTTVCSVLTMMMWIFLLNLGGLI